jgi:hypothetical protein
MNKKKKIEEKKKTTKCGNNHKPRTETNTPNEKKIFSFQMASDLKPRRKQLIGEISAIGQIIVSRLSILFHVFRSLFARGGPFPSLGHFSSAVHMVCEEIDF